jgi:hypothetical protein
VVARAASHNRLALAVPFRQTRTVDGMESELEAIQERLRALKRRLDARESVVSLDEPDIARGDPVEMNPLTAGGDDATDADV